MPQHQHQQSTTRGRNVARLMACSNSSAVKGLSCAVMCLDNFISGWLEVVKVMSIPLSDWTSWVIDDALRAAWWVGGCSDNEAVGFLMVSLWMGSYLCDIL
jgi:hypothetical protein